VEATAEVMISHVMAVGDEWSKETGRPLKFFGRTHEDAEEQHSFKGEDVQAILRAIELDSGTRRDFHAAVDVVFAQYTAFTDELLEAAQKARTPGQR
ncbi:MAG TPA: hypothetical protein VGQ57_20210, partial [Polyangiaceae bacterium]|nr:hypothetical protein [Polyangiaceae bacterium]